MCNCKPNITEDERHAQQITLYPPFPQYVANRKAVGLSGLVCIDPCIMEEIQMLWDKGIMTYGCCCGHNQPPMEPYVNVDDENIDQMLAMGYVQEHWDKERKDTFRLKSV